VEHFRCETANIRLGYRIEWSIYGADPKTLDLATEQSGALYSANEETLD
jgi:hypothetical protein